MGFSKTALFSVLCWAWQRSLLIAKAEVPACSFNQGLRGWKTTERGVRKGPVAGERNGLHPKDCLSQWADEHKLFPVSLQILTEVKIVSCKTQFYLMPHQISLGCLRTQVPNLWKLNCFLHSLFLFFMRIFPFDLLSLAILEKYSPWNDWKAPPLWEQKALKFNGSIKDCLKAVIVLEETRERQKGEKERGQIACKKEEKRWG